MARSRFRSRGSTEYHVTFRTRASSSNDRCASSVPTITFTGGPPAPREEQPRERVAADLPHFIAEGLAGARADEDHAALLFPHHGDVLDVELGQ